MWILKGGNIYHRQTEGQMGFEKAHYQISTSGWTWMFDATRSTNHYNSSGLFPPLRACVVTEHLKSSLLFGCSAYCVWLWLFAVMIGSSVSLLSIFSHSVRSNWNRTPRCWRDSSALHVPLKRQWLTDLIVWEKAHFWLQRFNTEKWVLWVDVSHWIMILFLEEHMQSKTNILWAHHIRCLNSCSNTHISFERTLDMMEMCFKLCFCPFLMFILVNEHRTPCSYCTVSVVGTHQLFLSVLNMLNMLTCWKQSVLCRLMFFFNRGFSCIEKLMSWQ